MGRMRMFQTILVFLSGFVVGLYVYSVITKDSLTRARQITNFTLSKPKIVPPFRITSKLKSKTGRRPLGNRLVSNSSAYHSISAKDPKIIPHEQKTGPKMVLILAYMRSGSSLTGNVIQQYRNTFYSFEPLFTIWRAANLTFVEGKTRIYNSYGERIEASVERLRDWFTCDLMKVSIQTLTNSFMNMGKATSLSKRWCAMTKGKRNFTDTCVKPLQRRCLMSQLRVIKTIRVRARHIVNLMKQLPGLKVIHLVRDPRGILASRLQLDRKERVHRFVPDLERSAKTLCSEISDDHEAIHELKTKYPDRIKLIRYEPFAEQPMDVVKRMYTFLGIEMTESIKKSVLTMTSSKRSVERDYATWRKNSTQTAKGWRLHLSLNETRVIDRYCSKVYKDYGYVKTTSIRDLRDVNRTRLWLDL